MAELTDWVTAVCAEFGLDPALATDVVLECRSRCRPRRRATRCTAHDILARTCGRSGHRPLPDAAKRISRLAAGWRPPAPQ